MNDYFNASLYRRFTNLLVNALSGNLSLRSTIIGCSFAALLLLGYVSMQIYVSRIAEKNAKLKREEKAYVEKINVLTSRYMQLSSRERVVGYCVKRLGMVEADTGSLVRVSIREKSETPPVAAKRGRKDIGKYSPLAFHNGILTK